MKYLILSLLLVSLSFIGAGNSPLTPAVPSETAVDLKTGLTAAVFEDSVQSIYTAIGLEKYNMSFDAFRYGMIGYYSLLQDGKLNNTQLITIIDFTKASTEKRFYTLDLGKKEVVFHSYVSHGKNTGENMATSFSNLPHSNQSSLGFYVTGETYVGGKGYSLKLDGMDKGYNDNIRSRAVVMHNADYVSESWIARYGRLGRSQGCPALPKEVYREVIDTIKDKTLIFAYYNDDVFLKSSKHLDLQRMLAKL